MEELIKAVENFDDARNELNMAHKNKNLAYKQMEKAFRKVLFSTKDKNTLKSMLLKPRKGDKIAEKIRSTIPLHLVESLAGKGLF